MKKKKKNEKVVKNEQIEKSEKVVKQKCSKLSLVYVYLIIWVILFLLFWIESWILCCEMDVLMYSILSLYLTIPVSTFSISLLIAQDRRWENKIKFAMPAFFGLMFMLLGYLTLDLYNIRIN